MMSVIFIGVFFGNLVRRGITITNFSYDAILLRNSFRHKKIFSCDLFYYVDFFF